MLFPFSDAKNFFPVFAVPFLFVDFFPPCSAFADLDLLRAMVKHGNR